MTIDEAKKVLENCPPDMHCCDACFLDERCQAEVLLTMHVEDLERQNEELQKDAICALARVPRWISVEERLPESGVHVLVTAKTSGGHKYVCDAFHAEKFSISSEYGDELACEYNPEKDEYFLEEGWYEVIKNWDDYSSIVIQDQVTHWMPLPELPEEDDHATD